MRVGRCGVGFTASGSMVAACEVAVGSLKCGEWAVLSMSFHLCICRTGIFLKQCGVMAPGSKRFSRQHCVEQAAAVPPPAPCHLRKQQYAHRWWRHQQLLMAAAIRTAAMAAAGLELGRQVAAATAAVWVAVSSMLFHGAPNMAVSQTCHFWCQDGSPQS